MPSDVTITIPTELWMFWDSEQEDWITSLDDAPGGVTLLVAFTQEEAIVAAEYQKNLYGFRCIPIRVK